MKYYYANMEGSLWRFTKKQWKKVCQSMLENPNNLNWEKLGGKYMGHVQSVRSWEIEDWNMEITILDGESLVVAT
jgi:hypothetical protein